MAIAGKRLFGVGVWWTAFWLVVLGSALWFLIESVAYLPYVEDRPGQTLVERRLWIYLHAAMAIPIIFLAPLQFHPAIRGRYPVIHRWMGRSFLVASLLAGATAIFLSINYEFAGSRPALFVFGLLWMFFSGAAWFCAVRGAFPTHRRFMIRSVAIGFAFIWVRQLREAQYLLLPFIEDYEMRTTVREFLCFIVPLIVVEGALSWWPALQSAAKAKRGRAG